MRTGIQLLALIALLTACGEQSAKNTPFKNTAAKITQEVVEEEPPKIVVHYTLDTLKDQAEIDAFCRQYSPSQQRILMDLNRYSRKMRKGMVLCIPDTLLPSFADYTTFPRRLNKADTVAKLILVSLRIQSFAIYETGKLVHCGPISSGSSIHPTPPGKYTANWKAKKKISTIDNGWIMPWCVNIDNEEGVALHQYVLPGYPASHSCVRLRESDAKWIYDWVDQWTVDSSRIVKPGTPVIVFGKYDFNGTQPWRLLPENPAVLELTAEEREEIGF